MYAFNIPLVAVITQNIYSWNYDKTPSDIPSRQSRFSTIPQSTAICQSTVACRRLSPVPGMIWYGRARFWYVSESEKNTARTSGTVLYQLLDTNIFPKLSTQNNLCIYEGFFYISQKGGNCLGVGYLLCIVYWGVLTFHMQVLIFIFSILSCQVTSPLCKSRGSIGATIKLSSPLVP